jgi:heme-degrading monooxygenase HmoA
MFVRLNRFAGDPARIDDGIRYIGEEVVPAVEDQPGNLGISMSVDRATGVGQVATFWADLASLEASEAKVSSLRQQAAERLGGALTPEVFEIVADHVRSYPEPGCWIRMTRVEAEPSDLQSVIDTFRSSTIPALDAIDGFCMARLSLDRARGRASAVTIWRDRGALEASRERAGTLRQEVADKAHGTVVSIDEMEVVLASMRAQPES